MNDIARQPAHSIRTPRRFPPWLFASVCILASAGATVVFVEVMFVRNIPAKLVGKWELTQGEMEGALMEFFNDGTMKGSVRKGGEVRSMQWQITMVGDDRFHIAVNDELWGIRFTETQTILELSDRYFTFQDSHGEVTKLTRSLGR